MSALVLGAILAGCAPGPAEVVDSRGLPEPGDYIYGAIASDEPSATIAARSILLANGTAADAAVSLYFALAVTAPSVASLGGGGMCLVHNPVTGKVDMLDFLAPPAANTKPGARPLAIPTVVRGMAALHGRYGRLPWGKLLLQAESLARSGVTISGQLAGDLQRAADRIQTDAGARRIFTDANGALLRRGDPLRQIELGSIIGQIRGRGAGAFYSGPLADRIVEGARQVGGSLSADELRAYLPRWRTAVSAYFGRDQVHVAEPPATAGLVAAQMWQMLVTDKRYLKATAEERWHLVAETTRRALSANRQSGDSESDVVAIANQRLSTARAKQMMADYDPAAAGSAAGFAAPMRAPAGSGFVVVDGSGMAVLCSVTAYDLFGTGHLARGTGMFYAPAPATASTQEPPGLMMMTHPARRTVTLAVAASGGSAGSTVMAHLAARTILGKMPLRKAMASARIFPDPASGRVLAEAGANDAQVEALSRRGHVVQRDGILGRLNAVYCPNGVPARSTDESDCSAAADPRGGGLARVFLFEKE